MFVLVCNIESTVLPKEAVAMTRRGVRHPTWRTPRLLRASLVGVSPARSPERDALIVSERIRTIANCDLPCQQGWLAVENNLGSGYLDTVTLGECNTIL